MPGHLRKEGEEGAGVAASSEAPGAGAACGVPAAGAAPQEISQPPLNKVSLLHGPWSRNAGQSCWENVP